MRISRRYVISFYGNDTEFACITCTHIPLVRTYSLSSLRDMGKFVSNWAVMCPSEALIDVYFSEQRRRIMLGNDY